MYWIPNMAIHANTAVSDIHVYSCTPTPNLPEQVQGQFVSGVGKLICKSIAVSGTITYVQQQRNCGASYTYMG